jgi:hypothetical protein
MNKYIPSFGEFLNEAEVPFSIEGLRLDKLKWDEDPDLSKDLSNKLGIDFTRVFVARDDSRDREYKFETWENSFGYIIRLKEDKEIIYDKVYPSDSKIYYDQDCQITLGFKIKLGKK